MNDLLRLFLLLSILATNAAAIAVSGTVITDGGARLADVTLTIEQVGGELPPFTATTAADGSYSVSDPLLFGNVRITAVSSGFTFSPSVRDAFTGTNLTGQNFTASSTGQIHVNVGMGGGFIVQGQAVALPETVIPATATIAFRLRNTGTGPLTGLGVTYTGALASEFSTATPPPATLAPGAFADFLVTASPQSAGVRTAVMHIASSDSSDNPFTVNLSVPAFASLLVSNLNDSGPGSLREAIASAAAHPGYDRIQFAPSVLRQTITLTSEITVSDPEGVIIAPQQDAPGRPLFSESFDASDGGWTVTNDSPTEGPWFYHAPSGAWMANGQTNQIDTNSNTRLISPAYTITQSGQVILTVRHRYSFEPAYDGGQILVQGPDGIYSSVSEFLENGYNGTPEGTDIVRQPAFVNDSSGHNTRTIITTRVLAGHFEAGQTLRVQFLAAFSNSVSFGFPAWLIDGVSVAVLPEGLPGITLAGGPGTNRLLYNAAGSSLELNRVTLTGGHGSGAGLTPGGGALLNEGTAILSNCTFYNNTSGQAGSGGAIASNGPLHLTHCTIARNIAHVGGGGLETSLQTRLTNCILAGNTLTSGVANDLHAGQLITAAGTNILQSLSGTGSGVDSGGLLLTVDPLLSPLLDCGGPTPTMALRSNSLARDFSQVFSSLHDQRGFRIVGLPDIGAYEAGATDASFHAYIQERLPVSATDTQRGPLADFDSDGQSNESEWFARTSPADPGSRFEPIAETTGAGLRLDFPSEWGRAYSLLESDSLAPGTWLPVPGVAALTGHGGVLSFTVPANAGRRFYQIAPSLFR